MNEKQQMNLLRWILLAVLVITSGAFYQFTQQGLDSGPYFGDYSTLWVGIFAGMAVLMVMELAAMLATWTRLGPRVVRVWRWAVGAARGLGRWAWLPFLLLGLLYPLFPLGPFGDNLMDLFPRLMIFAVFVVAGAIFVQARVPQAGLLGGLAVSALIYAAVYQVFSFQPVINNAPQSLDWSEGSRYFNASMFLSGSIFGQRYPLPVLHPTRYLMQAAPFLIPSLPIWVHRAWQAFLWLAMTWLGAYGLRRRLHVPGRLVGILFMVWAALSLYSGPIYYHLMLSAAIVLFGFDRTKFWRSLGWVVLASVWAGLSRINWFPVPGLLAAALYLLETPLNGRRLGSYLLRPVAWAAAGLPFAFAAQLLYIRFSGNPTDYFGSSFTSGLLWERLLPNATLPAGILLGSLAFAFPYAWLIVVKGRGQHWHWARTVGLGMILLVFYLGGMLVSIKVGGGSNLHNLDTFLLFLVTLTGYLAFDGFVPDHGAAARPVRAYGWVVGLLVLVPLVQTLSTSRAIVLPSKEETQTALVRLNQVIDPVVERGGKVLFITQTQLLPFHQVNVPEIYPQYDKVFLMEMVMAGNPRYLQAFHDALRDHAYDLIVMEPLHDYELDHTSAFWQENNLWVDQVVTPLKRDYHSVLGLDELSLVVLAPNP